MRIGHGYDVHKMLSGRKCILCGVTIPYEYGPDGHSDAGRACARPHGRNPRSGRAW